MQQQNFNIITHVLCPYVQRSIIILEEKNIAYTRTDIDLTKKPAWFEQKSPMGKVPILLVDEKRILFESAIICEYLNEITPGSLHPIDSLEKAYHRAWIEFGSNILARISSLYNAKEVSHFQTIHTEIQNKFRRLEKELSDGPFYSGEQFHLIDAVYGPIFRYFDVFDTFTKLDTFDDLPKCLLWRNTLRKQCSVQKAVPRDYTNRLMAFLINRESYITQLIQISDR